MVNRSDLHFRWIAGAFCFYFIILMHVYFQNVGGIGFNLPGNVMGALFLSASTILILVSTFLNPIKQSAAWMWLLSGGCVLLLPALWTPLEQLTVAWPRLFGLILGLVAYFSLLQIRLNRSHRFYLLVMLLVAIDIEAAIGFLQYFHIFMPSSGYAVNIGQRVYGIFQQCNVMATFIATGVPLSVYVWYRLADHTRYYHYFRVIAAGSLIILPCLLIVICSRAGLLGALLLVPLQLWALGMHRPRKMATAMIFIIVGAVVGIVLTWVNNPVRPLDASAPIILRIEYWRESLRMIVEKPLCGWGYGAFQADFLHSFYEHPAAYIQPIGIVRHPHNEWLFWGVEGGIPALFGLLVMFTGFLRIVFRPSSFQKKNVCHLLIHILKSRWVIIFPILFHTQVEYPFYISAAHGILFLILLRCSDVRKNTNASAPLYRGGSTIKAAVIVLSLLMTGYLAYSLYTVRVITSVERHELPVSQLRYLRWPSLMDARLSYDVHTLLLLQYRLHADTRLLVDYRTWATQMINIRPDANLYFNLLLVSRLLKDEVTARMLFSDAHLFFPLDPRFVANKF
jgi:O-antigen polymerase